MSEGRPRHDCKRHRADCSCHPKVLCFRRCSKFQDLVQSQRKCTQWDESIRGVKNKDERLSQGFVALPACQPYKMQCAEYEKAKPRHGGGRQNCPAHEDRNTCKQCQFVETLHGWCRTRRILFASQPVAGEGRDDAPADHRNHQDNRRQGKAQRVSLRRKT